MPKIDVIIPVYNQADKITCCLDSLMCQTFKDFSVIIINDGSTDNLDANLHPYSQKIKLINQSNLGANAARNRGAKESSAEYLLFCDADVITKPTMLDKMHKAIISNPDVAYVYSSFKFGFKAFKLWSFDAERLKKMPYIHTTSLIRKKYFPGFDENIKRFQDWDLWLTLMEKNLFGLWIPEILFVVKPGGTMSVWLPKFFYKLFKKNKQVADYQKSMAIIKNKHHLN